MSYRISSFLLGTLIVIVAFLICQEVVAAQRYIENQSNDDVLVCFYNVGARKTTGWDKIRPGDRINFGNNETWVHAQKVTAGSPGNITKTALGYNWDVNTEALNRGGTKEPAHVGWNFETRFFWVHIREPFEINRDYGTSLVNGRVPSDTVSPPGGEAFWKNFASGTQRREPMPQNIGDQNRRRIENGWRLAKFYKVPNNGNLNVR